MGFRPILDTSADREAFGAWRASVPQEVHDNMDADPLIPDEAEAGQPAARKALLDTIGRSNRHDPAKLRASTCRFCWSHGLEGPAYDPAPAWLGHVRALDKLADWISMNGSHTAPDELRAMLRYLLRLPPEIALEEQKRQLSDLLGDAPLSRYPMWSFFSDDGRTPVETLPDDREEVVNRLGLGHLSPLTELIAWFHRPLASTPRRPTAWDAELNPHWRPGGRTEPLDGSSAANGLPEAIHPPVSAEAVDSVMRRLD